jgi:crotonobetainyl-CoA:carnitine CoA-transferase CaiB-like acyl-CoA transferase
MIPEAVIDYSMNGRLTARNGNRHPHMAPHDVYRCAGADRWLAIEVTTDAEWRALCDAIGRPELALDPRFATAAARLEREDEIDAIVESWTRQQSPTDAMHQLQAAGIAAGPVMNIHEQMADPHFAHRRFAVEMDHPEVGRRTVAGLPAKFSAMPQVAYGPAPCFGEHNEEVFCGILGLSKEDLTRLQAEEVIF